MAEETTINGEISEDDVTGDNDKTSVLNQKISDLERENGKFIRQNEDYMQKIEELNASIKELSSENAERKEELEELESENNSFGSMAARAAELESEVWRLQQDLMSAMTDLQELTVEISYLKKREKEKDLNLDAVVKERDVLLAKLQGMENNELGNTNGYQQRKGFFKENKGIIVAATVMGLLCYVHAARKR